MTPFVSGDDGAPCIIRKVGIQRSVVSNTPLIDVAMPAVIEEVVHEYASYLS